MTARPKIEAARDVADWLEAQGEHHKAEVVRSLCRSNSSLVDTASRLRHDLTKLEAEREPR